MSDGIDIINKAIMENEDVAIKGILSGKRMRATSPVWGTAETWGVFGSGTTNLVGIRLVWTPGDKMVGTRHEKPFNRKYRTFRGWLTGIRRYTALFGTEPWEEVK